MMDLFINEFVTLDALKDTGVTPHVLGCCVNPPVLVMTGVGDLSLLEFLEICSCRDAVSALQAAAEAFAKIHEKGFVHGNVTLENMMVDLKHDRKVYIVDFTMAAHKGSKCPKNPSQSHFAAETLFDSFAAHSSQDVYAFGKNLQNLIKARKDLPKELELISNSLLEDNPKHRPPMDKLARKLCKTLHEPSPPPPLRRPRQAENTCN
nr:uncharacterized protein LOC123762289 [Procambarus clarkii]